MNFTELINEQDIWEEWRGNYKNFVPKFIEEAKANKNWQEWDEEVFYEFFMRSSDQCVSSLKQGYFNNAEKEAIKEDWAELSPLLAQISLSQDKPLFETYHQIKTLIRKNTGTNKKAATNRLIVSLQPKLLCTVVNEERLRHLIHLLNTKLEDFNLEIKADWFENSYYLFQEFKKRMGSESGYEIMTYPWQLYDYLLDQSNFPSEKNNDMSESNIESRIDLLKYKKQIILQGPPGTGKTREAKLIAKELLGVSSLKELEEHEQFKLVQFHPSYTYEDFVRGIVAKPNEEGEGVIYAAENKTLGKFAEEARNNFLAHLGKTKNKINFQNKLNVLLEKINTEINKGSVYYFGEKSTAQIISIKEDGLIYNFQDREEIKYKILFSDMEKVYNNWNEISKPIDLRDQEAKLGLTMKGKYPYYYMIQQQLISINVNKNNPFIPEDLKNYVLIIDEINRANLSSVLGELIYALEYRGETVDSMYEVGSRELMLPPNLYIIGTMNTADRSVGHIDYAIRRRFAFVDVLPTDLVELGNDFKSDLFKKVKALFTRDNFTSHSSNLSGEFNPKDVSLGHSYFIQHYEKDENGENIKESPIDFSFRLEYEIKPILLEYVKDGILMGNVEGQKIEDYIKAL